jgi:hypothetical protein
VQPLHTRLPFAGALGSEGHEHKDGALGGPIFVRSETIQWMTAVFEQLDFIYTPSSDVATEMKYFTDVLGGRLVFAVEGMDARVAMIELTSGPPHLLLADHLEGERSILVYRVADLETTLKELRSRGWKGGDTFEIPQGPICNFEAPGGHRIAVYELTRPDVASHFEGRFDF